jgi:hypothetical protein
MLVLTLVTLIANALAFQTLVPQYVNMPPIAPMDPLNEMTTETFRIGPFGPIAPHGAFEGSNVIIQRPGLYIFMLRSYSFCFCFLFDEFFHKLVSLSNTT